MAATTKPIAKSCPKWDDSDTFRCRLEADHEDSCVIVPRKPVPAAVALPEPIATDEALAARYHRALDIINALVPLVPPTAFAWPPAQDALREAHAMLVEEGRQVADDEEAKRAAHTQEATRGWLGEEGDAMTGDDLSGMVEEFERMLHRGSHEEHNAEHGDRCRHPKYQGPSIECPQCYACELPTARSVSK